MVRNNAQFRARQIPTMLRQEKEGEEDCWEAWGGW